jgi:hypothetical protein
VGLGRRDLYSCPTGNGGLAFSSTTFSRKPEAMMVALRWSPISVLARIALPDQLRSRWLAVGASAMLPSVVGWGSLVPAAPHRDGDPVAGKLTDERVTSFPRQTRPRQVGRRPAQHLVLLLQHRWHDVRLPSARRWRRTLAFAPPPVSPPSSTTHVARGSVVPMRTPTDCYASTSPNAATSPHSPNTTSTPSPPNSTTALDKHSAG